MGESYWVKVQEVSRGGNIWRIDGYKEARRPLPGSGVRPWVQRGQQSSEGRTLTLVLLESISGKAKIRVQGRRTRASGSPHR